MIYYLYIISLICLIVYYFVIYDYFIACRRKDIIGTILRIFFIVITFILIERIN
jgi:hypothetical protein